MPPRDPGALQLDFPLLVADLIEQLRLTGTMGLLNFLPEVRPTFIVGSRAGALTVTSAPIVYLPAEIFEQTVTNPPGNQQIITTGDLPAGDYDIKLLISYGFSAVAGNIMVQFDHLDAANVILSFWALGLEPGEGKLELDFALRLAENEELRVKTGGAAATGNIHGNIMAKLRPSP